MIKMKKKISLVIMAFAFVACGENDTPKRITPVIPQEEYVIVNETCTQCRGYGAIATMYGPIPCNNCNGQGMVSVKRKINRGSNIPFKGDASDGYIYQGGNISLTRVQSKTKDSFPHYKKGGYHYVKYGGSYIKVSGVGKFVWIGNIHYFSL